MISGPVSLRVSTKGQTKRKREKHEYFREKLHGRLSKSKCEKLIVIRLFRIVIIAQGLLHHVA